MKKYKNIQELEDKAKQLKNKKISDILGNEYVLFDAYQKNKGLTGMLIEYFFGLNTNSKKSPDFEFLGVELKVTPVIKGSFDNDYKSKERLVHSMINYYEIVNETFEESSLKKKLDKILLIWYFDYKDKTKRKENYFLETTILEFDKLPKEIKDIIRNDYELIRKKVIDGKAHELSGKDTMYLEALTKSSNNTTRRGQPNSKEPAKPRAFGYKNKLMNYLIETIIEKK